MLRLKNISEQDFSFEGITIPTGGVSEDLTPEIHGRLLALYGNRILVNYVEPTGVEEKVIPTPPIPEESKALKDFLRVKEKDVVQFICRCGKEFATDRALKGHKVGAKHN